MRLEHIIKLATEAAKGKDNFSEASVGFNGYGFVFRNSDTENFPTYGSHKFCSAGAYRYHSGRKQNFEKSKNFKDLLRFNPKYDLLCVGSLKTLVPTLQFGGVERLFDIWMLVITPKSRVFPATFYWRQSGLSIGGWSNKNPFLKGMVDPLESISEFINFSPFDFTKNETGCFLDALEFALKKVPISDFWGLFTYDLGNLYIGVKRGKPFIDHMRHFERDIEAEERLEVLLDKQFRDIKGNLFSIRLLPGRSYMKIYVLQFDDDWERFFGNARDVLEYYDEIRKN